MMYNGLDDVGQIIKQIRNRKKLKREEVSERAGISSRYLARIENEAKKPSYRVVYKIIRALGISANELVYPEQSTPTTAKQELTNLLNQLDEADVLVALATVRALCYREQYLLNSSEVDEK